MNVDKLSKRLETVVSYILKGSRIADIGSDHAYLPCNSVKQGIAASAIAGEVVEGPFQAAKKQVELSGLTKQIDVRKGNGLAVIEPGEVDCVIIAGMGGALITDILEAGKEKLYGVKRLILQPNIAAHQIRNWLLANDWQLVAEEILKEDGKYYEIVVADKGDAHKPYTNMMTELLLGPFLLKEKNQAFIDKWSRELAQWENIVNSLKKAEENPQNAERKKELIEKISIVREALK
ncbi:tRNA (adenine(22)-N(1))-methyltransferase TrmK [Bacillus sp. FJAT-50079]|uniref:tRNA (adenine(22)-N(1))-methyltransferase n=1 Tax=Bacillus sp. FJAT-50079 TaxID=2833577 RepID=UPI001BC9BC7F|nr:tRNA (adenine-N(1))-methyltransferase [Bacillus sp. FJAT-50079]